MAVHASSSSRNAYGFITRAISETDFDVGSLRVSMTNETRCSLQITGAILIPNGEYNGTAYLAYPHPKLWAKASVNTWTTYRTGPIACNAKTFPVGSRVQIEAANIQERQVVSADLVTIFRIVGRPPNGVALMEERPLLNSSPKAAPESGGTIWIDGFPLDLTRNTRVSQAPADTNLHYHSTAFGSLDVRSSAPHRHGPHDMTNIVLRRGSWVDYHSAKAAADRLAATQLRVWPDTDPREIAFIARFTPTIIPPDYTHATMGAVKAHDKTPVAKILANEEIQSWLGRMGTDLVHAIYNDVPKQEPKGIHFRFYVTSETGQMPTGYFTDIDGMLPSFAPHIGEAPRYAHGRLLAPERDHSGDIFVSPDGVVLVPATLLARLHNEAQAAALLSFAISSVLQKQGYRAWPEIMSPQAQRRLGLMGRASFESFGELQVEQQVRLGIRMMYLAGFDIREAPFAWSFAQKIPVANPILDNRDPKKATSWYTAYGFNVICHFYQSANFGKLESGVEEYSRFIEALRRADPDAFSHASGN